MAAERSTGLPLRRCTIAVFAPSPLVTVTIERGASGDEIHMHAGGQGYWVAHMASQLGAEVTLCVPLGGETGTVLQSLLSRHGITVRSVKTNSANGTYVQDRRDGGRAELARVPSPRLGRHELDDLYGVFVAIGMETDFCMLTGPENDQVLPAGTYERLAGDLRRNGRRVLADLSGAPLEAVLRGGLDLLKVSDEELIDAGMLEGESMAAVLVVARRLRDAGAANVLITRGERPALALLGERALEVDGPRFDALDERGAGDSLFAGVGAGLGSGLSAEDALRVGTAAGALNVTRHGLGTGDPEEISRLAAQVTVKPLPPDQLPGGPEGEGSAASTAS